MAADIAIKTTDGRFIRAFEIMNDRTLGIRIDTDDEERQTDVRITMYPLMATRLMLQMNDVMKANFENEKGFKEIELILNGIINNNE